jgi:hypothetical protein
MNGPPAPPIAACAKHLPPTVDSEFERARVDLGSPAAQVRVNHAPPNLDCAGCAGLTPPLKAPALYLVKALR